jgi:multiple sugar transport system substrate-binding protein
MKKICLVLVILALPALLFATGSSQQPDSGGAGGVLRFAWWGNTTRDAQTNEIVRLFMQRNPGVTVEVEAPGWADYWTRMNTLAAAGNLPDVMQHDVSYIKQYNDRNQLVDMNTYIRSGAISVPQNELGGHGMGLLGGKQVGLILGANAWGMSVNADILARAGVTINDQNWTWADYERIATEIFQKTGVQSVSPVQYNQVMESISREFGVGRFTDDDRNFGIAVNEQARNAFRDWIAMQIRLRQAGVAYDPEDGFITTRAMEEMPLARGLTWNDDHWSNQYVAHQAASQAKAKHEYKMLPTVAGRKAPFGIYLRASMYIAMLSTSNNKDTGARFVNFFLNDLEAGRIRLVERGVPIPAAVRNDIYPRLDAGNQHVMDYINRIGPLSSPANPPYPATAGETETIMRAILQRALMGQITADAAVAEMIREGTAILQR